MIEMVMKSFKMSEDVPSYIVRFPLIYKIAFIDIQLNI